MSFRSAPSRLAALRSPSFKLPAIKSPAFRVSSLRETALAAPAGIAVVRLAQWSNPAASYRLLRQILGPDAVPALPLPVDISGESRRGGAAPNEVGMDPAAVEQALELVRRRGAAAQLCVLRYGRPAVQYSAGCRPDDLFYTFSATKAYIVVLTHQLIERGVLELDAPVATYWPDFGRHGKDTITVRHVLQHRTGFATTGSAIRDLSRCTDWQQMIRAIADTRPLRAPGSEPAYQFLSFGFILGEVIQRITGRRLPELLRTEILEPLNATDTYLGIGPEQWERHVPVRFLHRGGELGARAVNRLSTRQAVVPSAGISTTAWDMARFYQMLLDGGRIGQRQLIKASTLDAARTLTTDGEVDLFCRTRIPWSLGFQLGGDRGPGNPVPMGRLSTRNTFGHNGSNCCIAWADPDRDLVFAYLTNQRSTWSADVTHLSAVADAILGACD